MTRPSTAELLDISESNIRELLKRLGEYENTFLSKGDALEPYRIYFADSDVMSSYIDGCPNNYAIDWTSLLSLTESPERRDNDEIAVGARSLADTISLAVSGFLFGRFLKSLSVQRGRFYLTPEHARELNGIKLAIVGQIRNEGIADGNWLEELQRLYVALCRSAQVAPNAVRSAEAIVEHLAAHSGIGKLSRLHSLQTRYTVPLSTHILAPPQAGDRAFILDTRSPKLAERVHNLTLKAFDVFLSGLKVRSPGSESYFDIKRKVLSVHKPSRRMIDYLRTVANDPELAKRHAPDVLDRHAKIAARQVADVVSLARVASLAEFLNQEHPLANGRRWEICLLTSSEMLRNLHHDCLLDSELVNSVRIVHPLCFLRHAELFDPEGAEGIESRLKEKLDEEYALKQILGGGEGRTVERSIDPILFAESLRRSLASVAARVAEEDLSMSALRFRLKHDEEFDHARYVHAVRASIAYFFFRAFKQINELAPDRDPILPSANIPMLSLPHPDSRRTAASEEFFVNLLERTRPLSTQERTFFHRIRPFRAKESDPIDLGALLDPVMKEDDSGYSTMLCAAVAYIAKGRYWLGAAETMASTAAMLALGGTGAGYPQGNEALYLKAFLLRMRFSGIFNELETWWAHHQTVMGQALEALEVWRENEAMLASEPISPTAQQEGLDRYKMIVLRYRVEQAAGGIYVWLTRLANGHGNTDSSDMLSSPVRLLDDVRRLLTEWLAWAAIDVARVHQPGRNFLGSQLWAVVLEGWLCASMEVRLARTSASPENQKLVDGAAELESAIANSLFKFMESNPDSLLIRMLAEIFNVQVQKGSRGRYGITDSDFVGSGFAAFDEPCRFPLFRARWRNEQPSLTAKQEIQPNRNQ